MGSKLAEAARAEYDTYATYRTAEPDIYGVNWEKYDKMDGPGIIQRLNPEFVIDVAAFHNVDKCEEERVKATSINAVASGRLATATREIRGRYVYVSTDFVFDGTAKSYVEGDIPAPVNVYGVSKHLGEELVMNLSLVNQVIRPSVIYGWNDTRLNFATWLLSELREGREVFIVTDWYSPPTFADSLAESMLKLMRQKKAGIFHLAGPDCMSRFEFAVRLARGFGLDESLVRPVFASTLDLLAVRPMNVCLENYRAKSLGIETVGVDRGITVMRNQLDLEDFIVPKRFKS